jgi:hypothetical protein
VAGEGEENVVERGLLHLSVVHVDRRAVERAHDGRGDADGVVDDRP